MLQNELNNFDSYLYGLLLTDGSISLSTRNRGKVSLELKIEDKELLYEIQRNVASSSIYFRTRTTNFKERYESAVWYCCRKEFRDKFIYYGIPVKNKSIVGNIPKYKFSISDFWRGVIDGNGSIGITKDDRPFISLTIMSENLKIAYCEFLYNLFSIKKVVHRNKRDNIYNIVVFDEDAISLGKFLYDNASIYLQRKYEQYLSFMNWTRIKKKQYRNYWTDIEVQYIQNHTIEQSAKYLNRSISSIKNKLYKLSKKRIT